MVVVVSHFRHGSRTAQEDIHLVCKSSQVVSHIKDRHIKRQRSYHHQENAGNSDVNMFAHDHRLDLRMPQPTSFDGFKPSFMEWSEDVIVFLVDTDYQEFIPLLTAATSSKDVMFTGVLSEFVENLQRKEADNGKTQAENKDSEVKNLTVDITEFKERLEQRNSTLFKADCLRYTLLHAIFRGSTRHGQKDHENVKFRFRSSRWTGNLASSDTSFCRISKNQDGTTA